jgi:hypothetical protein
MQLRQTEKAAFWCGFRSIFSFKADVTSPVVATFRGYNLATIRAEDALAQDWKLLRQDSTAPAQMVKIDWLGRPIHDGPEAAPKPANRDFAARAY